MTLHRNRPVVLRQALGWVRLWRDDLAEMVKLIDQSTGDHPVKILLGDEYVADSIDDLAEYPEHTVEEVKILADGDRVRLVLSLSEASISVRDPDLIHRGMVTEVVRIAQECHSRSLFSKRLLRTLADASFASITPDAVRSSSIGASGAEIFTQTRLEAPTFWTRKRDDLMIAIVSLLVGGVIGYLVNVIT